MSGTPALTIAIVDAGREDRIAITRADGTVLHTRFPKKGPFPHDAVHWAVESVLGLHDGFWGLVAAGRHPDAVADLARAAGHPSASRAAVPEPQIVQLLQAERLVECFEAELWSSPVAPDTFRAVAGAACAASHVTLPALSDADIAAVRDRLAVSAAAWRSGRLELRWPS